MGDNLIKIRHWLYPVSWLYGTMVYFRNKFFDWGWLQSKSFNIPIICVGNLAVGGTGKTPHTEYLIKLLQKEKMNIATLSRGYKRKSKGYLLAGNTSNAQQIGDEAYQLKKKFPNIQVAVDANRCHGISQLLKLDNPPIDAIILDDAFQHRYVKAGMNILLTDYNRLLCEDALLPAGMLREPSSSKNRAQIVIVTKCPDNIKPIDFNIITKRLHLYPYQQLYFSKLHYGALTPLFPSQEESNSRHTLTSKDKVVLVTGIATPWHLLEEIKKHTQHIKMLEYGDHHEFSKKDLQRIDKSFQQLGEGRKFIITTEKDAARLICNSQLNKALKPHIYVLPIKIEFLQNQQDIFNQNIIGYVRTNPRNSNLPQK